MATGPAIAVPIWLLRRSATLAPTALLSAALLGLSAPALADHDVAHVVSNLKGGLGALEQRVWDCENGGCPGVTGAAGPAGPQGPQGETGATGSQGPKGDPGEQGIQGIQGEKGDTGEQGAQGIQGEKGDTGEQGVQGIQGEKGDTGEQGGQGIQGDTGETGSTGLANWERVSTTCTDSATITCTAICTGTKKVLGGGISNANTNWQILQSYPLTDSSWTTTLTRNGGGAHTVTTYALCAETN